MIVSETEGDRGVVYIRCDARGCAQTRSRVYVPGRPNDSDIEKPSRFPVDGWTRRTVRNVQKDYCPTHADYGTVAARKDTYRGFALYYGRVMLDRSRRVTKYKPDHYVEQSATIRVVRAMPLAEQKAFEREVCEHACRTVNKSLRLFLDEDTIPDDDRDGIRLHIAIRGTYATRGAMPDDHAFAETIKRLHGGLDAMGVLHAAVVATIDNRIRAIEAQEQEVKLATRVCDALDGYAAHARALVDFDERVAALHNEYEAKFRALADLAHFVRASGGGERAAEMFREYVQRPCYHPLSGLLASADGKTRQ